MSVQAGFALRGRNPDVLTCIANLSNDEVFTPPEFANRMLDTLATAWAADKGGANIWAPIIAGPGTACTETYLVAGHFDKEPEADNYATYLRTRFVRFLVSLRKSTQDAPKHVYAFIPDLPLSQEWTDAKLYKRYGLTRNEIAFIESQVAEHDSELFDEGASDQGDE